MAWLGPQVGALLLELIHLVTRDLPWGRGMRRNFLGVTPQVGRRTQAPAKFLPGVSPKGRRFNSEGRT